MKTTKAKQVGCRSKIQDDGVPWRCDRPQGHNGRHQVHFPNSGSVLKSWAKKSARPDRPATPQAPSLPEWEGFDR